MTATDVDADVIRDGYEFACSECDERFAGDDLGRIAQRGARHWNKEHGDDLYSDHVAIDVVEYGGHHLHGNAHEVRKYSVYLTSFDIMESLGDYDGWLTIPGQEFGEVSPDVCPECQHKIPDPDDRIEDDPDDYFNDEWMCRACVDESEISRKKNENQSLTEWRS